MSTTDAVTARDFAHQIPRRARQLDVITPLPPPDKPPC